MKGKKVLQEKDFGGKKISEEKKILEECRKGVGEAEEWRPRGKDLANLGRNEKNRGEVERIKAFVTRSGVLGGTLLWLTKGHFSR